MTRHWARVIVSVWVVLFLWVGATSAQEPDTLPHYPDTEDIVIPIDVEPDLDASFPKRGSIFGRLVPGRWFDWKSDLYDKVGLKLGFSYQTLAQWSSATISDDSEDSALGGWLLIEAQWKVFNRGEDWEGSLSAALDWRHALGGNGVLPGELIFETGTLFATDAQMLPWDPYFALLFWEQHGKRDRFWVRVGQIAASAVLDFFRFKDPRVSFNSVPMWLPLHVIPYSAPGLGAAFKWNPIEGSELYVTGVVKDMNSVAGKFDWSTLFDYGEVFAGLEIGKHWRRGPGDFDHAHITVWYGDERSTSPLPTESGWGIKVHGTKQWNKLVAFANYAYNTSEGGGFGVFTNAEQAVGAGLVFLRPLDIKGEIGSSVMWAKPIADRVSAIGGRTEAQWGGEVYWRLLVLPQLWVTPGAQVHVNPTFNLRSDVMFVPHLKARVYF